MRINSVLCLLLLEACMSSVHAGLQVLEPEKYVEKGKIEVVAPKRKHLGIQTLQLDRVSLTGFTYADEERFCGAEEIDFVGLRSRFSGTVMLVETDRQRFDYRACFNGSTRHMDMEYLVPWCSLNATLIFVQGFVPGLFLNDHDGTYYKELKRQFPVFYDCELYDTQASDQLLEFLEVLKNKPDNETVWASLTVDEPPCVSVFGSFIVVLLFRGLLGGGMTSLAIYASYMFIVNGTRNQSNRFVRAIVLLVNAFTLFIIGFVFLKGGFRLSDGVSHALNNFVLQGFLGSGIACDYLLAVRWGEIKKESSLGVQESAATLAARKLWRNFIIAISITMVVIDWSSAVAFIYIDDSVESFLLFHLPITFAITNVIAMLYLTYTTMNMISLVRSLQIKVRASQVMDMQVLYIKQTQLVKRMRFWMNVSILSSLVSLLSLSVFAFSKRYETSCQGWVISWTFVFLGKIGSAASQIAICTPAPSKSSAKISDGGPLGDE